MLIIVDGPLGLLKQIPSANIVVCRATHDLQHFNSNVPHVPYAQL